MRPLIEMLADGAPPFGAIVGEWTELQGAMAFDTVVTGVEARSSQPAAGVNAITRMARPIGELERLEARFQTEGDPSNGFDPCGPSG